MSRFRLRLAAVLAATGLAVVATGPVSVADRGPDTTASGRTDVAVSWESTPTGSDTRFRGLSAVSSTVAWVGGTGVVLRTTDGGATWASVGPPDTSALEFRDVEATSDQHAVILSVGKATDSRIYVTDDGGASWTLAFLNDDADAFYDCLAFSTSQRGLALSDPVGGAFRLQETTDGGHTWSLVDPAGMPPAGATEFAFAASGSCLSAGQGQTTYLGSGGDDGPHIFVSQDGGHTWSVTTVPLAKGPGAGTFSVRFRDRSHGIALGGDLGNPTSNMGNAAWSDRRRVDVGPARRDPVRIPVRVGLAAARTRHRPRGRSDRIRRHDRCRTDVVPVRHRQLRQRRVCVRRWMLGVRRAGARGPAGGQPQMTGKVGT